MHLSAQSAHTMRGICLIAITTTTTTRNNSNNDKRNNCKNNKQTTTATTTVATSRQTLRMSMTNNYKLLLFWLHCARQSDDNNNKHTHTHAQQQTNIQNNTRLLSQSAARAFLIGITYTQRARITLSCRIFITTFAICALPFATLFSLPSAASSNHSSRRRRRRRCRRRCCCRHARRCRHCRLRHRHHRQHCCSVTLSSRRLNEH